LEGLWWIGSGLWEREGKFGALLEGKTVGKQVETGFLLGADT
jgi:hypothetical protein